MLEDMGGWVGFLPVEVGELDGVQVNHVDFLDA